MYIFQLTMLQICALLLYGVSYVVKISHQRFLRHWQALSLIFLCLSIDEALSFHEQAIAPTRAILPNTDGFLYFAWVVPGAILVAIFCLCDLRFLRALAPNIRYLFLIAGGLFVSGALGLEMVGGKVVGTGGSPIAYNLVSTGEELLEMLGTAVFVYALLSYIKLMLDRIEIFLIE